MNRENFIEEVNKLGLDINDTIIKQLDIYYNFLVEYNLHTNLTTITQEEDVYLKHFYDSLTVCKYIDLKKIDNVIDIGTGAGFPSVVIKIFFSHLNLTLLDSNHKKTDFLIELIQKLNLENVEIINDRAENLALTRLNQYDLCLSRSVAFIDIICELGLPFIKEDGKLVLLKGDFETEEKILKRYQNELNIKFYQTNPFFLYQGQEKRNIVIISKKSSTIKLMDYSKIIKRSKFWRNLLK